MAKKEIVVTDATRILYDQWHFAPAVRVGDTLHCSGVIGTGPGGRVSDDPETQFTQAFEQLGHVLEAAGGSFDDVVELTTYHVGLQANLQAFTKVKDRFIPKPYPAWTAIGVSELALPGGLVEIRATAQL